MFVMHCEMSQSICFCLFYVLKLLILRRHDKSFIGEICFCCIFDTKSHYPNGGVLSQICLVSTTVCLIPTFHPGQRFWLHSQSTEESKYVLYRHWSWFFAWLFFPATTDAAPSIVWYVKILCTLIITPLFSANQAAQKKSAQMITKPA